MEAAVTSYATDAHLGAGREISDDEISMCLRDHAGMGIIESVRPAGPYGWVLTVNGRELTLADQHQALIWLTAISAFQDMEEREASVPADWGWIGGYDGD
jgi:hypothetical protein